LSTQFTTVFPSSYCCRICRAEATWRFWAASRRKKVRTSQFGWRERLPLRIAAKIPRMQTHYFKEQIQPLLDGDRVDFVGEVDERQKQDFLGNAMAVLVPIDWPEPFGW
jgi:hypothetical protein